MQAWFTQKLESADALAKTSVGLEGVRLGILSDGAVNEALIEPLAAITRMVASAGGTVVLVENDNLLNNAAFREEVLIESQFAPTIGYARQPAKTGLHVMQRVTNDWVELVTGLGATGIEIILAVVDNQPLPGHPLIPVLQITANLAITAKDVDWQLNETVMDTTVDLFNLITTTLSGDYVPRQNVVGNWGFGITRGLLGVSL
jgi:hypothetical protein